MIFAFLLWIFPSAQALDFSIVTFNTWGVPLVVKDTHRYWDAMRELNALGSDVIAFQEVFSKKGRGAFRSDEYQAWARGPRAFPRLVSSGLRLLSKHPIIRSAQTVFSACVGDDCLGRKGALLAVLEVSGFGKINVVVTHLNARGEADTRKTQMDQIRLLIDCFAEPGAPLFLVGDFNFQPSSESYAYVKSMFQAKDAWVETHGLEDPGYTYDTAVNPYARDFALAHDFDLIRARLDYVFYSEGVSSRTQVLSSELLFNGASGAPPVVSDHYGILSRFRLSN